METIMRKAFRLVSASALIFLVPVMAADTGLSGGLPHKMKLTSPAFNPKAAIPTVHTCEGKDTSPPLKWEAMPEQTKSLVLIVDDPDAPDPANPKMTWVHWVMYDIPPTVTQLEANVPSLDKLPFGGTHGITDFKKLGYGGPCPPIGTHRYFFKLYALDTVLNLPIGQSKAAVEKAMQGHILDMAQLIGTYKKVK
jgi:Raf kinase inhibitor-like YbhB/YbcL family protein